MKKNKVIISILLFIAILMFQQVHSVEAWGPITHVYYTERALQEAGSTALTDIINANKKWFYTGMMYPDVTVLYYYTEWKAYSATHAWEFQKRLWQDAMTKQSNEGLAFALGVGVHLIQDSITHNFWIPYRIKTTFIQNNIIHPLSEGFLEAKLASGDPIAESIASTAFNQWNAPFDDSAQWFDADKGRNITPTEWSDKILGNPGFLDEAATFAGILGEKSFYQKGYVIPEAGGWWSIYKGVSDIVKNFVNVNDADQYINQTIKVTVDWFRSGQGDSPQAFVGQTDPTGYDNLKASDSYVVSWTIVIVIIFSAVVLFFYYRKYKGGVKEQ
jgi:hypothetical protein